MTLTGLVFASIVLTGCQLFAGNSRIRSNSGEAADKQLADTIALGMTYPYERESGSYLFVNGIPYAYESLGKDLLSDATVRAGSKVIQAETLLNELARTQKLPKPQSVSTRTPVIAYGSNAAVSALKRKFMSDKFARGWAVIPVIKAELKDFEVVHAGHFVPVNGSFPAGLAYSAGAETEVWITYLDEQEMERMHASEGIDADSPESWYAYGKLDNIKIRLSNGREMNSAFVYIDNYGGLKVGGKSAALAKVPAQNKFPAVTMQAALEASEDIFKRHPASAAVQKKCSKWEGAERRLCENISDACARDDRTDALLKDKRVEFWNLPLSAEVKFTRLAGSDKAGHPKAFPDSMRCARAGQ
ncbi:MAG: hypothetical protein EBR09_15970 [Proteobacteria bacterium]|nr:hypothetical protein [Pseudomonadota bacterium]